jgi:hypothetical protein
MVLMHMVEMTIHEVVRMIAVRNGFMAAARAVLVTAHMAAGMSRSTFCRIGGIHFQLMLVDMIAMDVVHMAIVKEALVPIVHDGGVAALISMLMRVSLMNFMTHVLALLSSAMPGVSRG